MVHPVESLLDLDYYKLTMGQFVFHRHRGVEVKYGFNNRSSSVRLTEWVPIGQLREELDFVRGLRFAQDEIEWLSKIRRGDGQEMFKEDFLEHLASVKLPAYSLMIREDGQFDLTFEGPWEEAIYWETIALSIVNELYFRSIVSSPGLARETGRTKLFAKGVKLKQHPAVKITEFGTRRRFSGSWQEEVLTILQTGVGDQLVGTSNVHLARKMGLTPSGTMAHELFMVMAALMDQSDQSLRASHNLVLREWHEEYGEDLSTALTDTFGTSFFFEDLTSEQARQWHALRQDSGDPFEFSEKAIAFYRRHGINTKEKTIVYSDGLDVDLIVNLWERYSGDFNLAFGWGTNLTNDLGYDALSLVVKANQANGRGTVKLSDNLAKAQGSPKDVERYKHVFGHSSTFTVPTRY